MIDTIRQQRIPALLQVQTNGSLLNRERAAYLQAAQVGIGVSLDGRPEDNDRLRCLPTGGGTCREIVSGVRQLAALGMEIGLTCVVAGSNARQLSGVMEMAYYLGNVRRIGFDLLRAQGRGGLLPPADVETVAQGLWEALQTMRQLAQHTGKTVIISQLERVETLARGSMKGFAHCPAMKGEAAFVDARGNIYACSSLVGNEQFRLGHVQEGIDERRRLAVAELMQNSMAFCRHCSWFPLCGGGCFARWYGAECAGSAYTAECTLKQVFIKWYEKHGRTGG